MLTRVLPGPDPVHYHDGGTPHGPHYHAQHRRETGEKGVFRPCSGLLSQRLLQPAADGDMRRLRLPNTQPARQLLRDQVHHVLHLHHSAHVAVLLAHLLYSHRLHSEGSVLGDNHDLLGHFHAGLSLSAQNLRCLLRTKGEHLFP